MALGVVVACGGGGAASDDAAPDTGPPTTAIRDARSSRDATSGCGSAGVCDVLQVDFDVHNADPADMEIERMRLRVLDCAAPCVQTVDTAYAPLGMDPVFCRSPLTVPSGETVTLWLRWSEKPYTDTEVWNATEWSCPGETNPGFHACVCTDEVPPRGTAGILEIFVVGRPDPLTADVTL